MSDPGPAQDRNEAIFLGMMEVFTTRRFDRLGEFLHDDYTEDYPQSGERIPNLAALRAIFENYPGMAQVQRPASLVKVSGGREQWVLSPTFTVIRTVTTPDEVTAVRLANYPDGSTWWAIGIYRVRDGKIASSVTYFAAPFEAPAWRAPYVERLESPTEAAG